MRGAKPIMLSIQSFGEYRPSPHPVENVMQYGFSLAAMMLVLSTTSVLAGAAPPMRTDTPTAQGASSAQMSQCNSPDPARAIIGCSAIIQKSGPPDLMGAVYSTRGLAYQKRGENDLAIADLDQAIKLDSKNAISLRSRGDFYQAQGDY